MKVPNYLFDFYSISLRYHRGVTTKQQETAIKIFLEEVKQSLLKDVSYCVYRELRHAQHWTPFAGYTVTYSRVDYESPTKHGLRMTLNNVGSRANFFKKANKAFSNRANWYPSYGGSRWARIAKLAALLEEDNFQDVGNSIVLIDRLVDAAHNTGRCLDKVYPGINKWLDKKRCSKKTDWIIRGSNRKIRHIFR